MKWTSKGTPGEGPFEGLTWDGRQWVGEPTEAAMALRAQQPRIKGRPTVEQVIADRLSGVIYAVLAVLAAVVAGSAVILFGTSVGGLVALACLAAAGILGIIALIKA
jgi:hypothetical protein